VGTARVLRRVQGYSEDELPVLRCRTEPCLEIDAPPGEPPTVSSFVDGGGVAGVRRPAEDIEGVGDTAVEKLSPVESAETGTSFSETMFTSCPRADSLSSDVEDTFVGAVEASDGWLSDHGDFRVSGAGAALCMRFDGDGGADGGPCGRGTALSREKLSSNH